MRNVAYRLALGLLSLTGCNETGLSEVDREVEYTGADTPKGDDADVVPTPWDKLRPGQMPEAYFAVTWQEEGVEPDRLRERWPVLHLAVIDLKRQVL